jgi:hypothetical protein
MAWHGTRTDRGCRRERIIGMTSLRRIRYLEAPLAVHEVVEPSWVAVMRERRRGGQNRKAALHGASARADWAEVMREPIAPAALRNRNEKGRLRRISKHEDQLGTGDGKPGILPIGCKAGWGWPSI